jgi:hypothetical protein
MDKHWIYELVKEKGNILCPFCGKPFLKFDFQVITDNECQHDIEDILKSYYSLIGALTDIYHAHRDSSHTVEYGEVCFYWAEEVLSEIETSTGLSLL